MGKMNESSIDNRMYVAKKKMASKMPAKEKKDHFGMTSKESSDYQRRVGRAYND